MFTKSITRAWLFGTLSARSEDRLFFRYDHEEARRLAAVLDKTLRHRKRTAIHICTRATPPNYAQLIITDHFSAGQ